MKTIKITTKGVKSALHKYNEYQAISEYIWNGFDAGATRIDISYKEDALGVLEELSVKDNGQGIPKEELDQKFKPFYESEKNLDYGSNRNNSNTHGKNGVGRLTFFKFANKALWDTTYELLEKKYRYQIEVVESSLEGFNESTKNETNISTGTIVKFTNLKDLFATKIKNEFISFLKKEFCWFLELHKRKGYSIFVNGEKIDYEDLVGERETVKFTHKKTQTEFDVEYIRWKDRLNNEYSKYYYLDSTKKEKWKENTKLNNKGDSFYHSLFITSKYFNNFNFSSVENSGQKELIGGTRSDDQFEFLLAKLAWYLRKKRKPFLKVCAERLVSDYIKEEILVDPKELNRWEQVRQEEITDAIKGIYQVQPKVFFGLNAEQKKTMVGFLGLIVDSDEKDKILDILQEIVDLDSEERAELWNLLRTSKLSSIISTIKMVQDRQKVIESLKELVFNPDLEANEVDHVQQIVEDNYWIFGEQYNLVTAAEPKFEEALRRYQYLLRGDKEPKKIDHPDKNKEMDVFICRQMMIDSEEIVENVVVELKSPKIALGKKEYDQVETYLRTIKSEPRFNGDNSKWTFILIGNKFQQERPEPYIASKINSYKSQGKHALAMFDLSMNYEVYVKKWSEIFNELDLKHKFLNERLKMRRDLLQPEKGQTADEIVDEASKLSKTIH